MLEAAYGPIRGLSVANNGARSAAIPTGGRRSFIFAAGRWWDDGKNGVCLHLVFENDCTSEIYADTCIEHEDNGEIENECWTSSKPVGTTIDLSQCHATGKYFQVATTSAGQLDIDEDKCPAPE